MQPPVLGIDVGTSSSCVAVHADGKTIVLPNRFGYSLTPSVFALTTQGRILVGDLAKKQAITNPLGTVMAFKRLFGRPFTAPEVAAFRSRAPYPIVCVAGGLAGVSLHGRVFTPQEIYASLLTELKRSAAERLGGEPRQAVIAVPAFYNDVQRQLVIKSAEQAGLEVLRLLNEPTAAALAYGVARGSAGHKLVAVYDFGGGTFDATLMSVEQDIFEVLETHGVPVGGDDCDALIMQECLQTIVELERLDLYQDRLALARLREAAEGAKLTLSTQPLAKIDLPFLADRGNRPFHFTSVLRRSHVELLAAGIIRETIAATAEILRRAGKTIPEIDDVILIGGMTRMPAVREAVTAFFQRTLSHAIHPEEAVARGAAILGARLQSTNRTPVLLDIVPHTLSVAAGSTLTPIVKRGTKLPARRMAVFATTVDNQRSVKVRVVQGDAQQPDNNTLLGIFEVTDLPPMPRGEVKIQIEFFINTSGLLEVTATNLNTGTRHRVRISESLRNSAQLRVSPAA